VRVFFDTSAFAKRYVEEPGSERVRELCATAHSLGLSILVVPELIATLCRLVREGQISAAEYLGTRDALLADLADSDLCPLDEPVLTRTLECLEGNALRAADAVHVASALAYPSDLFVSADRRQIAAARKEGLTVEDLAD
jgi:predicted nucleic acid-binding protein